MVGVILFRAQPFHNGHLHMVKRALVDCMSIGAKLHIFIGSADKSGTKRNPLPIEERMDLVMHSIAEEFSQAEINNIRVWELNDLSDEANNTYSWGKYLYDQILYRTQDDDLMFFYSDKPEIMLSWFDSSIRYNIFFKFLERHNGFNATEVRIAIKYNEDKKLKDALPPYVYRNIDQIRPYIINAK